MGSRCHWVTLALLVAVCRPIHAQQPAAPAWSFTLDQVLSAPLPIDVVGAPQASGRFAWVSIQEGRRSVWTAALVGNTSDSARARRVIEFARDDGQAIGGLTLSRSGTTVAFVRGEDRNAQRENPNPSSDPKGAEQAVWVAVGSSPAKRIGVGESPVLSPDGGQVVFQRDSTLYIAPTTGAGAPRPLFLARGLSTQPAWSPDGRMVAFTSERGTHSFVGVYDIARDSVRWMSPGVDRDREPRWSPDGSQLAFLRIPAGAGGGDFVNPAPGLGFAMLVGDPRTGVARERWHSEPSLAGRLAVPTAGEFFLWSGKRLVFFLERDGWQHLYSISAAGDEPAPVQLTSGACEVEQPSPSSDGESLYYTGNCGDIDRKHLWRVTTAGGAPQQLTSGSGIEYAPAASGRVLFFLRGDARQPPAPAMLTLSEGGVGREIALRGGPQLPATFPLASLVEPQGVLFTTAAGEEIHGQLFLPPTAGSAAPAPAVIFTHGGPSRQMLLGWHASQYYWNAYAFNQYLASRGYVVLSVNYHGGVGYGRAFRESPRRARYGASEYEDVVAGARFLISQPVVDSTRIGLWGGSYGGFLTALAMGRNPELFKAGVDVHGVHDWNARWSSFAPAVVARGPEPDSVLALGRQSSPVCCVASIRGPLLLVHGDDDRNVGFSETVTFVQLLRKEKKPFELLVFPDEVHGFLRHASWRALYAAASDFFDRTLMRKATAARE
jgi:dipeptidyl aminopeptidase/acylaminoacyl peptidase